MAIKGVASPQWYPIEGEGTTASPYTYGGRVILGAAVKVDDAPNIAKGELWGDNRKVETESELTSSALTVETTDITDTAASALYGVDVTNGTVTYSIDDAAPYGGFAFIENKKRGGKVYYKGYFYPYAQATIGNRSRSSRNGSVTFQTRTTAFECLADDNGAVWLESTELDSKDDAQAWIDARVAESPAVPGEE